MGADNLEAWRFPIGVHRTVEAFDRGRVESGIASIAAWPGRVRARLAGLGAAELEKRYRPGSWTAVSRRPSSIR
jgi:hypothetical protein